MTPRRKLATDAWGALLQTHAALVPAMDKELQSRTGLPLPWYDVLLELATAPEGRLRMSDLADRVVLSRTRVSRLVDELVARGLVSKADNPDDRRSAHAVVTQAGLAEFRASAPVYVRAIEERFAAHLTDDELVSLASILAKVPRSGG